MMTYDLVKHLFEQRKWSIETFGPHARTKGVISHIRKELVEVEKNPYDVEEWIDIVLLALDGAWRHGHAPEVIVAALSLKLQKNQKRVWPDWTKISEDKAIEHTKT